MGQGHNCGSVVLSSRASSPVQGDSMQQVVFSLFASSLKPLIPSSALEADEARGRYKVETVVII
jgi:hypothetical protein